MHYFAIFIFIADNHVVIYVKSKTEKLLSLLNSGSQAGLS